MVEQNCVVCAEVAEGYHFGAYVCRPCAAFFRRSVAESKNYICRKGNNCTITKATRNNCRACRMKKCKTYGMGSKSNDPKSCESSDSPSVSSANSPKVVSWPFQSPNLEGNFPKLRQLASFLRCYFDAEKSLYFAEHPELAFSEDIISQPIDLEASNKHDKHRQIMVDTTLAGHFPFIHRLPQPTKLEYIKSINLPVFVLTKMILTVGTFPHNEKMFASQVGHHFDLGKPDTIFPQKYEFVKPTTCATLVELRKFASKCVALQMEEIDLGFLTGMILNFKLKQLLPNDAEVESCRSEVVQEYNNYLNMKLGINEGCVKFANVFLLFSDLNDYMNRLKENIIMFDLFGPEECRLIKETYFREDKTD